MANEFDPNPFKAPAARVDNSTHVGAGELVPGGKRVPAGNASAWIGRGWEMFKQSPGAFIGVTLVFLVITILLGMIPIVNLLSWLLMPVFMGGMMLGCKSLDEGNGIAVSHLFEGFSRNFGGLVMVGLLYLAGILAIALVGGVTFALVAGGAGLLHGGAEITSGALIGMLAFILVMALLIMPLAMAFYYAPPLVIIHDVSAFNAMKMSFSACLKNWLAFLVYFLIFMVLAILASLPLFLGWIVLTPVIYGSMYASYRDMFVQEG